MVTESNEEIDAIVGDTPVFVGRGADADLRVHDSSVSKRHAVLRREEGVLVVEDLQSRFGTRVNGDPVRVRRLRSGDRVQFGESSFFRVEDFGLRRDSGISGITVSAKDLEFRVDGRLIVRDVVFDLRPNEFIGILGPSGSGKSTLLNCLAGFLKPARGTLVFDDSRDASAEPAAYQEILGYVPQRDQFHETLSVNEILEFAASLRFAGDEERPLVERRISETLGWLGMEPHRHKRQLSGGQWKRVGIAVELLKRPRLLLLDEPTSPLDPAGEAKLMSRLRHIARQGTTVVCTTHKTDNIQRFDRIIVLGVRSGTDGVPVGEIAYIGSPLQVLEHFGCKDFADLYERLETGDFEKSSLERSHAVSASWENVTTSAAGRLTAPPKDLRQSGAPVPMPEKLRAWWNDGVNRLQLSELLRRSCTLLRRDRGLIRILVAQPLILGGLVCLTQFGAERDGAILFFAAVIAIWLGLNNAVRELVKERAIYVREQHAGLRSMPYFLSKGAYFSLLGAVQLTLLLVVLQAGRAFSYATFTANDLPVTALPWQFFVLMLVYQGGLALGLGISALARGEAQAIGALPFLVMPQLLLSAVATGESAENYIGARAFRPLVVTMLEASPSVTQEDPDAPGSSILPNVVDAASMLCYSRPATVLLRMQTAAGYSIWGLIVDFLHLLVLVSATWYYAFRCFNRSRHEWPRLVGFA